MALVRPKESAPSRAPSVVCCPNRLQTLAGAGSRGCPSQPTLQAPPQITLWGQSKVCNSFTFSLSSLISCALPKIISLGFVIPCYIKQGNLHKLTCSYKHTLSHKNQHVHNSTLCVGYYLSAQLWSHPAGSRGAVMTAVMEPIADGECLMFWYYMEGSGVGQLSVYLQTPDNHRSPAKLWTRSGDQGKHWRHARVTLSHNTPYQVPGG